MSRGTFPYLEELQNIQNWDMLQSRTLTSDLIGEVLRFHQRTVSIPTHSVHNIAGHFEVQQWISGIRQTDALPAMPRERISLNVSRTQFAASADHFDQEWRMSVEALGALLYRAFGRDESLHKRYPSAGALYPILPILCVFGDDAVAGIRPGAFAFDARSPGLLRLETWLPERLTTLQEVVCASGAARPSRLAIAYAMDMRRALTKYRFKGYRHALIEVGLGAQAFREALREVGEQHGRKFGERCWSDFADNALTAACGLDIRLAPITLLQWFGALSI